MSLRYCANLGRSRLVKINRCLILILLFPPVWYLYVSGYICTFHSYFLSVRMSTLAKHPSFQQFVLVWSNAWHLCDEFRFSCVAEFTRLGVLKFSFRFCSNYNTEYYIKRISIQSHKQKIWCWRRQLLHFFRIPQAETTWKFSVNSIESLPGTIESLSWNQEDSLSLISTRNTNTNVVCFLFCRIEKFIRTNDKTITISLVKFHTAPTNNYWLRYLRSKTSSTVYNYKYIVKRFRSKTIFLFQQKFLSFLYDTNFRRWSSENPTFLLARCKISPISPQGLVGLFCYLRYIRLGRFIIRQLLDRNIHLAKHKTFLVKNSFDIAHFFAISGNGRF